MVDETKIEAVDEAPVDDPDHITITLSDPIKAYGEEVSVLKMRKPTGADLLRVGNPVDFYPMTEPAPTVRFNMPLVQAMVARLANIPTGSVEKMTPQDLIACGWKLAPFFLPAMGI